MRILKLEREKVLPKSDYTFEKMKDFKRLIPYIRRKIEGEWCIILLDLKYKEIEEVIQMQLPDYANIIFYTSEDIKEKLSLKYPQLIEKSKTKHEQYLDYMATINADFTKKAVNELYSRHSGNLTEIKVSIAKIIELSPDAEIIDVKEVDKVVEKDTRVYANDLILSYLLVYNNLVPKKGSRLSKYRYTNRVELRDKFLAVLDRKVAFYACRKYLKYLYDERVNYLNGKDYKEVELMEIVDYYEITHAWITFQLSKPDQFEICLMNIERRKSNDSIFDRTILGIDT